MLPGMNRLLFGDNLNWLRNREVFPDASVDLIYFDPPLNSKRDYNLLFKSPKVTGKAELSVSRGGGAAAPPYRGLQLRAGHGV